MHSKIFEQLWGLRAQCAYEVKTRIHQSYRASTRMRDAEVQGAWYKVIDIFAEFRVELYKQISKVYNVII